MGLVCKAGDKGHNKCMSQRALKVSDYLPEAPPPLPPAVSAEDLSTDDRKMAAVLAQARSTSQLQKSVREGVAASVERLVEAVLDRQPVELRVREMRESLPDLLRICRIWNDMLHPHVERTLDGLKLSKKFIALSRRQANTRRVVQLEEYHSLLQGRLNDTRGLRADLQRIVRRYRKILDEGAASLPPPEPLPPRAGLQMDKVARRRLIMSQTTKARAYLAK